MKKCIVVLLVVATMILCLTGCSGKKASAVVTFDSNDVTLLPTGGLKNIAAQVENSHIMTVNVGSEGVFTFPIMVDGNVHSFTLTYANGQFTAEADPALTFTLQ